MTIARPQGPGSSEASVAAGSAPTLAEILDVVRPQVEKIEEGFKAIRMTLEALAQHLGSAPSPPSARPVEPAKAAKPAAPMEDVEPVGAPTRSPNVPPVASVVSYPNTEHRTPNTATPTIATATTAPPMAQPAPTPAVQAQPVRTATAIPVTGGGNWSQIIFGDALKVDPGIGALSGALLSDVYAGLDEAIGMLGHLLSFRAADAERKPKLLKDMGEAFYLWKPQGDERVREPLITWVHALLDKAGINNRIEVVQLGDRYDMQRHNAKERGVEVYAVSGWVVLRDNGKVYSKANVSVR
jgi:hypothetical protein